MPAQKLLRLPAGREFEQPPELGHVEQSLPVAIESHVLPEMPRQIAPLPLQGVADVVGHVNGQRHRLRLFSIMQRPRAPHPPMEYMGRGGATNFAELISWPSHLPATLRRTSAAISSSVAPERISVFTSSSSMANRQ